MDRKSHRILTEDFASEWIPGYKVTFVPVVPYTPTKIKIIDNTLDLHGLSVHEAYIKTKSFIEESIKDKIYTVTIITGRSGQIKEEFLLWTFLCNNVINCTLLQNKGSYRLCLKKQES